MAAPDTLEHEEFTTFGDVPAGAPVLAWDEDDEDGEEYDLDLYEDDEDEDDGLDDGFYDDDDDKSDGDFEDDDD